MALCGSRLQNQVMGLFLLKIFRFTCKINTLHNCTRPNQRASDLFDFGTKRPPHITADIDQTNHAKLSKDLCCVMNQLVLHIYCTRNGLRTHDRVILSCTTLGQTVMLLSPTTITCQKAQLALPFHIQILSIYHGVRTEKTLKWHICISLNTSVILPGYWVIRTCHF